MTFYYPNRSNDFWRMMGLVFLNDRDALWDGEHNRFDLAAIKQLLSEHHIALWDTGMAVRRLKDNASDKFLEIVEPIDLAALLASHPSITHVGATGEKAASIVAAQAGVTTPATGIPTRCRIGAHELTLHRLPSTSRAYPLALEKKAESYRRFFADALRQETVG